MKSINLENYLQVGHQIYFNSAAVARVNGGYSADVLTVFLRKNIPLMATYPGQFYTCTLQSIEQTLLPSKAREDVLSMLRVLLDRGMIRQAMPFEYFKACGSYAVILENDSKNLAAYKNNVFNLLGPDGVIDIYRISDSGNVSRWFKKKWDEGTDEDSFSASPNCFVYAIPSSAKRLPRADVNRFLKITQERNDLYLMIDSGTVRQTVKIPEADVLQSLLNEDGSLTLSDENLQQYVVKRTISAPANTGKATEIPFKKHAGASCQPAACSPSTSGKTGDHSAHKRFV